MRINSVNNISFKALIVDRTNQTSLQRKTINTILKNNYLTKGLVDNLEESDTDIVIAANPDGRSVDLRLETDAFMGITYIPFDERGKQFNTTITPQPSQSSYNTFLYSSVFFKKAENLDLSSPKNIEAVNNLLDF